ncbi:MAG: hypothetical protein ACI9FG_000946 [Crocinitomicaceae bacterium]|jgi:hypothetical protein
MNFNINRRAFINTSTLGLGATALQSLAAKTLGLDLPSLSPAPHFAPKAKRVIFLTQAGGPSHLETFDYKPKLGELDGQPMPESFTKGQPIAQLQGKALKCFAPQHEFSRHGKSGQQISNIFPHMAKLADDICIVRSMVTEQINHDPAHTFFNTGTQVSGHPCMGSWALYGLGSASQNLPGFVVLTSSGGGQDQPIAARQWHSGFLPSKYQGVHFHSQGDPVLYAGNPPNVTDAEQHAVIQAANGLNNLRLGRTGDPEIATKIAQYEMAFRMQASVPDLTDLSDERPETLAMYGATPGDGSFASNCLLARRMAERGVRFIQLYHRGWDHHGGLKKNISVAASHVDQGTWALVQDLKQRGMLEDTLVVWSGEFGRTPMAQGNGRDHHIKGFSLWMAGGGVKGGITHGATDELGYNAVENVVTVHDFHATMLHLLGLNHNHLTAKHQGLDKKLTGVDLAKVVKEILA